MLAMSIKEERQVAESLSPGLAWPTLRLAAMLPLSPGALIAGALTGYLPLWLLILPLGCIHFAYYTLVHESIHGNVARRADLAWVHTMLGWLGALMMVTSYTALRRIHLLHHQHTNTDADPDYNLCHGLLWKSVGRVVFLRTLLLLPLPIFRLVPAAAYTIKQARLRRHAITVTALQLAYWIAVALGFAKVAFLLYWVPMMIGLVLLNVFFQWRLCEKAIRLIYSAGPIRPAWWRSVPSCRAPQWLASGYRRARAGSSRFQRDRAFAF